jgi:hypothetical protein
MGMMKLLRLGVASLARSVWVLLLSVRLRLERLVSQARKPLHQSDSEAEPKAESRSTKIATRRRKTQG